MAVVILFAGITGGMVLIPKQYHSMRIDLVYTPSVKDVCWVFYDSGKGFSMEESVKFDVYATVGVGIHTVKLPTAPLNRIRINPILNYHIGPINFGDEPNYYHKKQPN